MRMLPCCPPECLPHTPYILFETPALLQQHSRNLGCISSWTRLTFCANFIFNLLCCLELFYYHLSCRMYICVFSKVLNMNVKRKHFRGYFLSHPPVLFVSSVSFISLDFDYLKLVGIQYSWQYSPGNCNIYEKHFILLHFSSYTYFTL